MQNMAGRLELCQPLNTSTNVENWDFLFLFWWDYDLSSPWLRGGGNVEPAEEGEEAWG